MFLLDIDSYWFSVADFSLCHLTTEGNNRDFNKFSTLCVSPYNESLNSRGGRGGPNSHWV